MSEEQFDVTEALELNRGEVRRMAIGYEGYGKWLLANRDDELALERCMVGAISLVIAASYWSTFDPWRSRELFSLAASEYYGMDHPYFAALAVCGENSGLIGATTAAVSSRARQEESGLPNPKSSFTTYLR